jgi:GNAT superfamily N-acetyltransferase
VTLRLAVEAEAPEADRQAIRDRLDEANMFATGRRDWYTLTIVLRDETGVIRGGVLGNVWASWLHVDVLWVDEDCRRRGWGTRLLEAAEAHARERGCTHAHLDTFGFQAGPRFYERVGYRIFGVLPDHPAGHTHYFLWRRL